MSENTMYQHRMLFVEEVTSTVNPNNGKTTTEVSYATWLVGVEYQGAFYGRQVSCGDLLEDDEVIIVSIRHCSQTKLPEQYHEFKGYSFSTEVDQLPSECFQLKRKEFEELCEDTQRAILSALDAYNAACPRSA